MTTNVEYALMAAASYVSTRPDVNKFPVPQGWTERIDKRQTEPSGFEATHFTRGTEIVISFAGTDPKDLTGDWLANIGLAVGTGSSQLAQAAEYYLQVKAANPGATITLTGHSLGGGLAALVGVFFGVEAHTFDQAPFAASAGRGVALNLLAQLAVNYSLADLAPLATYTLSGVLGVPLLLPVRAANVSNINVAGEALSVFPATALRIGRTAENISHGLTTVSGTDLHAQSLLAAFLQSQQSALGKQNLSEVTKKLTDVLGMMFDKKLYAQETDNTNTTKTNFLENLVRHQAGNIGGIPIGGDAMVARFTKDLWTIAQDGGLTMSNMKLADGLSAFAMQKYYDETSYSAGYGKVLYTAVAGGLHFNLSDVAGSLDVAKGYTLYLKDFFATLPGAESTVVTATLSGLNDWYFQAGANAMSATAGSQTAFMLGWNGADRRLCVAANDPAWRMVA